jgi:hypothetical protein
MRPETSVEAGVRRRANPLPLDVLALILVVLAGTLCLAMPFFGDQALFAVYGRQLTHGAVLYRDVFDVKQPGIFMFYASGGLLFGFTEVGIHLFELAYWLAFSVFTVVALRPYFTSRWGAPLVPVFTVVVYYLYASLLDLTQIEMLVAFPILLAWWLIDQAQPGTRRGLRRYVAAGLAAAAVVLLKDLYILIIVAFLGYAVLRTRRRGVPIADIRRCVAAFLVALLIPLLVVVAYFAAYGQLGRIWWAYFELAPKAQLSGGRPLSYFVVGARRFMIGDGPILILAVLGVVHALRERTRPKLDLVIGMMLWGALGAVAFFIQGWAAYKWSLFTAPFGILAVVGFETLLPIVGSVSRRAGRLAVASGALLGALSFLLGKRAPQVQTRLLISVVIGVIAGAAVGSLASRAKAGRRMVQVLVMALAVSLGLAAIVPVDKFRTLMTHDFALTVESRADLRRAWAYSYQAADADLEVLSSRHIQLGSLYVFGDPVLFLRANRPQAVAILGWGPELYDARAWRELDSELRSTLPSYIVVDRFPGSLIRSRYPPLMEFIRSRYRVSFVGASGTWYALR